MDIMLIIGVPFSVLLVAIGSLMYWEGYYYEVFTSRIITAILCFTFCSLDIYLLGWGPVELQAKKYIIGMSMVLDIYIVLLVINLLGFHSSYEYRKEAKIENEVRLARERRDREEERK